LPPAWRSGCRNGDRAFATPLIATLGDFVRSRIRGADAHCNRRHCNRCCFGRHCSTLGLAVGRVTLPTISRTVVVVEDNEEIRDILRLVFECDGYQVVGEVDNGADALTTLLKLAANGQPDFAVLDCRMPTQTVRRITQSLQSIRPNSDRRLLAGTPGKAGVGRLLSEPRPDRGGLTSVSRAAVCDHAGLASSDSVWSIWTIPRPRRPGPKARPQLHPRPSLCRPI
jgi:Response regulator receiver domain